MKSPLPARWTAVALAAALAWPSLSEAQRKKVDRAEQQARAHFKKAQRAYDLAKFEEALTLYSEAYDAKPLPGFLFNIAQCHRQLGSYERARFFYQRYLDLSEDRPKNAEQVESLIAQVDAKLLEQAEHRRREEQERLAREAEEEARRKEKLSASVKVIEARNADAHGATLPPPDQLPPPPKSEPVFKRWWFWAGVGAVAAGTATAVAVASQPKARPATIGEVDLR